MMYVVTYETLMNGSCIGKSIILMFLSSSRDKCTLFVAKLSDRCFCWFPAAMLVPIWMGDLILGEVVYIAIIYYIPDS